MKAIVFLNRGLVIALCVAAVTLSGLAQTNAKAKDKKGGGGKDKKADCGSQSIGNIDLNRQAGVGPREIFIFAPNAINVVGPRGCQ